MVAVESCRIDLTALRSHRRCRDGNHRNASRDRVSTQFRQCGDAIHPRQANVHQDQRRPSFVRDLQTRLRSLRFEHAIAAECKDIVLEHAAFLVILDDQYQVVIHFGLAPVAVVLRIQVAAA